MTSDLFSDAPTGDMFLSDLIAGRKAPAELDEKTLVEVCQSLNAAYRRGEPLVTDLVYDRDFLGELRLRNPEHPFLQLPEPEPEDAFNGERVRHAAPMLSTDKAYEMKAVSAWTNRIRAAARDLGIPLSEVVIQTTPKLDGIAGHRYEKSLVTRGKNGFGVDVSRILDAGVVETLPGVQGPGEIVVEQAFFAEKLAQQFELDHPRNFMAGLAGSDQIKDHHREALNAGVCRFVSYQSLDKIEVGLDEFDARWEEIMLQAQNVPYLCDGAVSQVVDAKIREYMGATSHHHRWMLALKRNDLEVETQVLSVRLTTGRTGRVTPTLEVAPVAIGGSTVSNVVAHTARHLEEMGLGPGAKIRITRGGGVIPKLLACTQPSEQRISMAQCPCCGSATEKEGAYIICPETSSCTAQATTAIEHFFKTISTARGFGPAVCDSLVEKGITRIDHIYRMDAASFVEAGISAGVAKNLVSELERSRREPLAPNLLLGAMGVRHLGRGDSRRLLEALPIDRLGEITPEIVAKAEGFGPLTSGPVARGVQKIWPSLQSLLELNFNLEKPAAINTQSQVAGLQVVFTGSMVSGSRDDMEKQARLLGAKVGGSVTGKTNILVCGANVGSTKTDKAKSLGVKTMTEAEWNDLVSIVPPAPQSSSLQPNDAPVMG